MSKASHQKHGATVKPDLGVFGRNEWALIGAHCGVIQQLAGGLFERLSEQWKLAYLDADHGDKGLQNLEGFVNPPHISYTDKIGRHRLDMAAAPDSFRFRHWFHEMDAVLINGNHFIGRRQIVIIDPAKEESLQHKLDRLTDVKLILLQKGMKAPYPFLLDHLAGREAPVLHLDDLDTVAAWIDGQLQEAVPPLRGLVLAGGYSKRMGRDKGLIEYHGKPQREHMADLLAGLCAEVFISCRPDQVNDIPPAYNSLPDSFYDLGPFGAIVSAFRAHPDSAWMVVACDLPLLDAATLAHLAMQRNPSCIATAFNSPVNEFPEPLIAIWEPKAYPTLLQFLSQGHSCPRKVLINSPVKLLTAPDGKALANANTPEEAKGIGRMA